MAIYKIPQYMHFLLQLMAEVEVPPYFLCPITLQIMKDPVTVPTGITYDRDSIEKWIFSHNNTTCPVTKHPLIDLSDNLVTLTPNITLRRLIQSWCTLHASQGFQRLPTPNPPVTKSQVLKLLNRYHVDHMTCLKTLSSIASHSQTNRRCLEMAGTAQFLASLIVQKVNLRDLHLSEPHEQYKSIGFGSRSEQVCDEALSILYALHLSESTLNSICSQELVESLTTLMQLGSYESRAYAFLLLKSILEVAAGDPYQSSQTCVVINLKPEFFMGCTQILSSDQMTQKSAKDTLKLLVNVCQYGRNRIKAVEAGAVPLLVDLLLDSPDKRSSETILILLEFLCQCAEGRAELLNHGAGLAIVSQKILRVPQTGSERAVKILHSIAKFSASGAVLQEMLQIGVVAKLCFVLQTDCGAKMKEKCKEILELHARAWRISPCLPIPHHFIHHL